jgi:hypothetical protein
MVDDGYRPLPSPRSAEPVKFGFSARPPTVPVIRSDWAPPTEVARVYDVRRFDQAKVHGARAALTLVADQTRAGEPTVTIESATRVPGDERAYAWKDKLRFQLTGAELQLLTCLLLGSGMELTFRNHGDKWCSIVRQSTGRYAGSVRVTMGQGDAAQFSPRTVAIDFSAIGPVTALCLRQCAQYLRVPVEVAPKVLAIVARAYTERGDSGSNRVSRDDTERPAQ